MALIRPFRNSDTHRLANAWQEHWHAAGEMVSTASSQLEQAILDKPFFEFNHMLVIEEENQLVGFSHLQTDPSEVPAVRARIASFCIGNCEDRDASASELLQASINLSISNGIREFEVGTVLGDLSGLVGLEPYSGVLGMLDTDQLILKLLEEGGFQRRSTIIALDLNLRTFRAPIDRELMMLRRMAKLDEQPLQVPSEWRAACAHSHFDITEFTLSNRAGHEIATATYYMSDHEASVMDRGLLYLASFGTVSGNPLAIDLEPEVRYVVSGSLPVLALRQFHTVRAIVDLSKPSATARVVFLESMGFSKVASGASYYRRLVT